MASIKKRKDSYLITVSLGRDMNGKQILENTTFKPTATTPKAIEREVDAFAREFEERVKNGKFLKGEKITFCDFLPRWREDYAKDHISVSVLEGYELLLKRYIIPNIGNMKLSKINALHINAIYSEMKAQGKAQGTIKKVHAVISGILNRAYKWGIIEENVCRRVDLPTAKKKKALNCFTIEQANTFLNVALKKGYETTYKAHTRIDDTGKPYNVPEYKETRYIPLQYQVFFNIALFGGFRRGEIISLTWNDINYDTNSISITKATAKTKSEGQILKAPKTQAGNREIILPQVCFDMLKRLYIQQKEQSLQMANLWLGYRGKQFDDNFIFIQDNGLQMDVSSPTHKFKEILINYNSTCENEEEMLPLIRLHDLRHTSASLLVAQKTDVRTISNRLGHSNTSVTLDIYSHAFKEVDAKASNTLEILLEKKA